MFALDLHLDLNVARRRSQGVYAQFSSRW